MNPDGYWVGSSPPSGFRRTKEDEMAGWIAIRDHADSMIKSLEERDFVQVKLPGSMMLYTFRDPSGQLQSGDKVIVGVYRGTKEEFGVVMKRGRGSYRGTITASVKSLLEERPL